MGGPRSRRSGHLHGTSTDLPLDPAGGAAIGVTGGDGGALRLPPITLPTAPGEVIGSSWEEVTSEGGMVPDLRQEGHVTRDSSVTPFGNEIMSVYRLTPPTTSEVTTWPPAGVRGPEESSSPSRSLNYALQEKRDTGNQENHAHEDPDEDLLVSSSSSSPAASLHAAPASPASPHYLTTSLDPLRGQPATHLPPSTPQLEEAPRTLTPEGESERGVTTATTTTTTTTASGQELSPNVRTTTTATTTTTTSKGRRPTREPRRKAARTQRSAPSSKRLQQPSPAPRVSVCANNPSGMEPSCHAKSSVPRGFVCYCDDKSLVEPGASCSSRGAELPIHPPPISVNSPKEFRPLYSMWLVGVASLLVVMMIMLVFWRRKSLCAWIRHRHREKKPGQQPSDSIPKHNSLVAYNFISNPNYYTQGPDTLPVHTLPVHLIHPEQISFVGELGEGCFGKVYKGTYSSCCPEALTEGEVDPEGGGGGGGGGGGSQQGTGEEEEEGGRQTVAVKVIKESVSARGEEDFMREVEIMSAFSHPNILTLIGIVAKGSGGTPWMVFEYMPYGDLAELLRSCGPNFYSNHTPVTSLSKNDLLHISVQIASGMEYLSSQHFVHRDLACRNCLVGEDLTVKISDFGMSRDVYTCDYYKVGGSRMLPVRWMAPESIMYGKFTLESDVWSFGVVLWEIYSFGKQPYYGNSNENVMKLIFQGILLSPPDTCPPKVRDIMRRCWATDPMDRLKFPEILAHLKGIRGEGKCLSRQDTSPRAPVTPNGAPVTYSQLCLQEEAGGHLDQDLYLVPRRVEPREYMTVLNV